MKVMITVRGTQHVDGQSDTVELTTDAMMREDVNGFTLCYHETAATGMEGALTILRIHPEKVTMERRGSAAGLLVLEHKKRHVCSYPTPVGSLMLGVFTDRMEQNLALGSGELLVSYTLDVGGRMMSRQDLQIIVHS